MTTPAPGGRPKLATGNLGIACPECSSTDSQITTSHPGEDTVIRTRRCRACQNEQITYEVREPPEAIKLAKQVLGRLRVDVRGAGTEGAGTGGNGMPRKARAMAVQRLFGSGG